MGENFQSVSESPLSAVYDTTAARYHKLIGNSEADGTLEMMASPVGALDQKLKGNPAAYMPKSSGIPVSLAGDSSNQVAKSRLQEVQGMQKQLDDNYRRGKALLHQPPDSRDPAAVRTLLGERRLLADHLDWLGSFLPSDERPGLLFPTTPKDTGETFPTLSAESEKKMLGYARPLRNLESPSAKDLQ